MDVKLRNYNIIIVEDLEYLLAEVLDNLPYKRRPKMKHGERGRQLVAGLPISRQCDRVDMKRKDAFAKLDDMLKGNRQRHACEFIGRHRQDHAHKTCLKTSVMPWLILYSSFCINRFQVRP